MQREKTIYILGLGAGSVDALTLEAYRLLKGDYPIFLRTDHHPVISLLEEEGITYESFDYIYEEAENFDQVYADIVSRLLVEIEKSETGIIYAVPGHPMVAERSVKMLRKQVEELGHTIKMVASSSFLDDIFSTLDIDPNDGFMLLDGLDLKLSALDSRLHTIISQVYSREVASEVKLLLMEYYPEDHPLIVIQAAGVPGLERRWEIPLYELDFIDEIDHLTALYLEPAPNLKRSFGAFVEIVESLRAPGGCPWDQEQTHMSLRAQMIEEVYEVIQAIEADDMDNLAEELGDVLLHVVMNSVIASEGGDFHIYNVIEGISEKMIRRHPHVFGTDEIMTSDEVLVKWEEIKAAEKADRLEKSVQEEDISQSGQSHNRVGGLVESGDELQSVLSDIPDQLPALIHSYKQQKKAAKLGFDWDDIKDIWAKVEEEINELRVAETEEDKLEELGDSLFALVNLARAMKINPELALRQSNQKFARRFAYIENKVREAGLSFDQVDLAWMDQYWEEAKKLERK